MKTTEIFIEQVIIGFLVLGLMGLALMVLEPGGSDLLKFDFQNKTFAAVVWSAGALAAAYLIGIVYDRICDTLMGGIEQMQRLRVGLTDSGLNKQVKSDPFPEQEMRIQVLAKSTTDEYSDYLRTRLRLTRALATLLPALMFALLLGKLQYLRIAGISLIGLGMVYGVVFLLKIFDWPKGPPSTKSTDAVNKYRAQLLTKKKNRNEGRTGPLGLLITDVVKEPVFFALAIITGAGLILALRAGGNELLMYPLVGFVLALLVGWVWWRIYWTYLLFLFAVKKHWKLLTE